MKSKIFVILAILAVILLVGCKEKPQETKTVVLENPFVNAEPIVDSDGDWVSDKDEIAQGTDPNDIDSDDDGLKDGEERFRGTNPLDDDSDDDGYFDGQEVLHGTNPLDASSKPVIEDSDGTKRKYDGTVERPQKPFGEPVRTVERYTCDDLVEGINNDKPVSCQSDIECLPDPPQCCLRTFGDGGLGFTEAFACVNNQCVPVTSSRFGECEFPPQTAEFVEKVEEPTCTSGTSDPFCDGLCHPGRCVSSEPGCYTCQECPTGTMSGSQCQATCPEQNKFCEESDTQGCFVCGACKLDTSCDAQLAASVPPGMNFNRLGTGTSSAIFEVSVPNCDDPTTTPSNGPLSTVAEQLTFLWASKLPMSCGSSQISDIQQLSVSASDGTCYARFIATYSC